MEVVDSGAQLGDKLKIEAVILATMLVMILVARILDRFFWNDSLQNNYGVEPRTRFSLTRIFFSPFLHGDAAHLRSNLRPLLILAAIVLYPDIQVFIVVTLVIMFIDGMGTWIFGKTARHLGASGLLLGYFSFSMVRPFVDTNPYTVVVGILVFLIGGLYARMFRIILVRQEGISTAGHFFGFLGGIVAAWLLSTIP